MLQPATQMQKRCLEAEPAGKAALGQYMTPANIAAFMAALFPKVPGGFHLLDAGAGEGSLTCAFLDGLRAGAGAVPCGELSLFELDAAMAQKLASNTAQAAGRMPVTRHIHCTDFIEEAVSLTVRKQRPFTHALLNPPYKKIHSHSRHRALLRDAGIETVNLYAAFVALAVALLQPGGVLVAIIPRSFCNGPYYKAFRMHILRHTALRQIHLFASRTEAFKADKVLQENVVIKLERDAQQGDVLVSASTGGDLQDYAAAPHPFAELVRPGDSEKFIYIPNCYCATESFPLANASLASLGIEVSTGPVVDFRLKQYLRAMPQGDDAPLLYPGHFAGGTAWPRAGFRKANALACCPETMKWLYPAGCYVVVRRLSFKEDKRRITAHIVDPACFPDTPFLGFENHLNVFHCRKKGLKEDLAHGLAAYLNSRFIDALFRRFNGHTQVNAADLRALPYPSAAILIELGLWVRKHAMPAQEAVDQYLEEVLA